MAEPAGPQDQEQGEVGPEGSTPRTIRWPRLLRTWPRRLGALLVPPLVGWAAAYFLPGIWSDVTGQDPLEVTVLTDLTTFESKVGYAGAFTMPKPLSELDDPRSVDLPQLHAWAHARGGVDAYHTLIRIVVRGRSSTPVVLQALQVDVVARMPPSGRTLVQFRPPLGEIPVRHINVDLDKSPPTVRFDDGGGFPLWVSSGEAEVLDVLATTSTCDCQWTATLHFTAEGESSSITIDDEGEPFETTVPEKGHETAYCVELDVCTL
jgi:hypothetical protein